MRKNISSTQPSGKPHSKAAPGRLPTPMVKRLPVENEPEFTRQIYLERRRAERYQRSLLLVLMDGTGMADPLGRHAAFHGIIQSMADLLRDTDVLGWYSRDTVLGILLPNLEQADQALIRAVFGKFSNLVENSLGAALARRIELTVHAFPDPLRLSGDFTDSALYPELQRKTNLLFQALKRGLDLCLSLPALALLSPVFALLAVAIKCSSHGPVLFRQVRLGCYAKPFIFLKFRTMYLGSDAAVHENYVAAFIAGRPVAGSDGIYKITHDPRVTGLGRILRRTSLDELPQLWNVLRGDMSLVGPRPPLSYEFERYAPWHRRRILDLKPGITGLWQVWGRSSTTFDEMVRLDLRYARHRSLWLDLKILFHTPGAMLSGKGAY